MREIKFRQLNGKDWHYWGFIGDGFTSPCRFDTPSYQFTGLKDKNGKEIYEGDIVSEETAIIVKWGDLPFYSSRHPIFEVKYFIHDAEKTNPLYGDVGYNLSSGSVYFVIGNIYENPELLK